jgi:asparagine synthase (glutamine-hydrolysing)
MCGIAGIYAYHYAANPVDRDELRRIRDHMSARGPDGFGEWFSEDGRLALGHRRLSIIDLSDAGAQPMASADGKIVVTFNGEIYNYRELRKDLEAKGRRFRSQSDTEVLLHLYAEQGEAMVHSLRGMFAFAIWDHNHQRILLVRDPYGIKPLYYADDGWTVRFASQVKAIMAGGKTSNEPDPAGWVGYYLWGSVPEPHTSYQKVRAVPAGSILWVDRLGPGEPKPYFSVAETYVQGESAPRPPSGAPMQYHVRDAVLDSVRHHLIADVPVGVFLSGGIDSGALVGLMRDAGQNSITTVTVAFEEFRGTVADEAVAAQQTAHRYGTNHATRVVTESEFRADLPKILAAMDQPTIDGINAWFVSKAIRELGLKVAISGLGGDELFGGYATFRDIPGWVRALALPARIPLLGDGVRILASSLQRFAPGVNPKAAGLLKYGGSYAGAYLLRRGLCMPWELGTIMDEDTAREGLRRLHPLAHVRRAMTPVPRTAFGKIAALESSLYMRNQLLRDADWASMAHSVETRVPLVDATLLGQMAQVTAGFRDHRVKTLLASSPRVPLPKAVLERSKTGFATPVECWLQRDRRLQHWKRIPGFAMEGCPWARRWAYQVAAS